MARNLVFSRIASVLLYFLFDARGRFLDYAGGYGIFTRLMRDIGFDFRWHDPYTENLVARGFEYSPDEGPFEVLTVFEAFEHFVDPLAELTKIMTFSRNVLFSTELLPNPAPALDAWWYYGPEHGQHVAFYSRRSLEILAARHGLHFQSNGGSLHLFSEKPVSSLLFALLCKLASRGLSKWVAKRMQSLTLSDMRIHSGQKAPLKP